MNFTDFADQLQALPEKLAAAPEPELSWEREAAVALAFAPMSSGEAGCLLIRRAENPSDPWSGHVGLPGGRREPRDMDLAETSIRETREEVGLALPRQRILLQAPRVRTHRAPEPDDLRVSLFLFILEEASPPGLSDEVAEARWFPVRKLLSPKHAHHKNLPRPDGVLKLPAMLLDPGWLLWGLTYLMIYRCLEPLGHGMPAGPPRARR